MKLHKHLVNSVAGTLREIFRENRYADKAIERLFKKNPKWGSRDRRFVAEAVYDIVRYFRYYSSLAESENNFWFITGVWLTEKNIEIPEWPEFRHLDKAYIERKKEQLKNNPRIMQSYPDWLWELGEAELGKGLWEREAAVMNEPAKVVLRVNTLKTSSSEFEKAFQALETGIKKITGLENAYELIKRENIFRNEYFKKGWFEVQDAGSQQIGEFMEVKPGEMIVDACAGAGGKSLHLAALMKNKGKIVSMDVEERKLEELRNRANRAGAFNIEARLANEESVQRLKEKADKVLLDVPCSGTGVIKRNPDSKWKLSAEVVEKTRQLQQEILSKYSVMVRPGGSLFYSTCSILPSENKNQVNKFLESNPNFIFVRDKSVLPSEGYDGFYMCELKKLK
jgi:16S rRNA (cytosine967-C5)-methyltransferase